MGTTWDAKPLLSKLWEVEEQEPTKRDIQEKLSFAIYKVFHLDSKNISDHFVVADFALEGAIFSSKDAALEILRNPKQDHASEFKHKLRQAEMNGVQSLAFYTFNDGADHLSQTNDKESFMKMIKMATALYR